MSWVFSATVGLFAGEPTPDGPPGSLDLVCRCLVGLLGFSGSLQAAFKSLSRLLLEGGECVFSLLARLFPPDASAFADFVGGPRSPHL